MYMCMYMDWLWPFRCIHDRYTLASDTSILKYVQSVGRCSWSRGQLPTPGTQTAGRIQKVDLPILDSKLKAPREHISRVLDPKTI